MGNLITYSDLDRKVFQKCRELDVPRGTVVPFVATPCLDTVLLLLALYRLQAIACPLNFRLPKKTIESLILTLPKRIERSSGVLLFTSGTSGNPKMAFLSFSNLEFSALGLNQKLLLQKDDCWALTLPLYHVGGIGILFRCLLAKAAIYLPEKNEIAYPPFVTHLSMVPTQLVRMETPPASLKAILLGGAFVSETLLEKAKLKELLIFTTYGLTEMSSAVTLSRQVLPFRQLKIAQDGEILVKGETLFQGYYMSDKITLPLDDDGWFSTKDLGSFSQEEGLKIVGRKDRLFISGGENIQPEEIENAILNLPGIKAVHVTSIFDEEFGQRPIAYIDTENSTFYTLDSLRDLLREQLPSYKLPVQVYPWQKISIKNFKTGVETCR